MPSAPSEIERGRPKPSENSLAALRAHAIKPGEVRNKTGGNNWTKAQARFRQFALGDAENGLTRDENVLRAIYESALLEGPRGAADRTLWQEHMRGRAPKIPNEVETAEHLRAVEKDRISTVIACLGSKLRTLTPEQMRDFFETCANDPQKFLTLAEKLMEGEEQPAVEQPEQAAQLPETKP